MLSDSAQKSAQKKKRKADDTIMEVDDKINDDEMNGVDVGDM
jgi:hypothetical protein